MSSCKYLAINLLVSIFSGFFLLGSASADEVTKMYSDWAVRAGYEVKGSYWFTSDDDDGEEDVGHALDYEPELIPTHAFQVDWLWQDSTAVRLYYQSALGGDGADQDGAVEVSDNESAIEELNALLDMEFLKQYAPIVNRLRFGYKKYTFVGNASVQENTDYYPESGGITALVPGDEISFKSEFEEIYLTYRLSKRNRVGVYQATTNKPHETSISAVNNIVMETEISGQGIKFVTESRTSRFDINFGQVKFEADQAGFRADGWELLLDYEWRPQIYLIGSAEALRKRHHALALVPLFGIQFSMQYGGEADGFESDGTGELAMDIIIDAGLNLIYQF